MSATLYWLAWLVSWHLSAAKLSSYVRMMAVPASSSKMCPSNALQVCGHIVQSSSLAALIVPYSSLIYWSWALDHSEQVHVTETHMQPEGCWVNHLDCPLWVREISSRVLIHYFANSLLACIAHGSQIPIRMEKNAMLSDTENVGKMWTLLIATRILRFVMTSLVMK